MKQFLKSTPIKFIAYFLAPALLGASNVSFGADIAGKWEVTDLYCAGCKLTNRDEIGKVVTFKIDGYSDDFSGTCSGAISLPDFTTSTSGEPSLARRINKKWLAKGQKFSSVIFGDVRCRQMSFISLAQIAPRKIVYFVGDGDISLLLVKSD